MLTDAQQNNIIDDFNSGPLNGGTGSTLTLFTNNVLLSPQMVVGDFDPATFDGGDPLTGLTGWAVRTNPVTLRGENFLVDPPSYIVTGPTNLPQTIHGYMVVSDGGELAFARKLVTPIILTSAGNAFNLDVACEWNPTFADN